MISTQVHGVLNHLLPQIEHPDRFADTLGRFLDEMEPFRDCMENPDNTPRKEEL